MSVSPQAMGAALAASQPQPDQLDLAEPSIGGVQQGNVLGWGLGDWANAAQNPKDTYKALIAAMRSRARTYAADDPQLTQNGIGTYIGEAPSVFDNPGMNWGPGPIGAAHGMSAFMGSLGGPKAITARLPAMKLAQDMEAAGAKPEHIWQATHENYGQGWFKSADGQWKFEIPDEGASMNDLPGDYPSKELHGDVRDVWDHPELFKAYPDLADWGANLEHRREPSGSAREGDITARGKTERDLNSVMVHEVGTHGPQMIEDNWAQGGSPWGQPAVPKSPEDAGVVENMIDRAHEYIDQARPGLLGLRDRLTLHDVLHSDYPDTALFNHYYQIGERGGLTHDPGFQNVLQDMREEAQSRLLTGDQVYHRLTGEVEARAAQARIEMTPEERAAKPFTETMQEDVPWNEMINKFGLDTAMSTKPPAAPTIKGLASSFDTAIARHLALPEPERIAASKAAKAQLKNDYGVNGLLGKNLKMMKTETGFEGAKPIQLPDGRGVETTGLSLAPAYEEGNFTTCPNSASCKDICLGKTSGGNFAYGGGSDLDALKGPRLAHFKNTQAMLRAPEAFAVRLNDEITAAKMQAAARGNHLGVRLNVLSDINPRVHKAIIDAHPDVTFYDYTKNATNPVAPNHHYTYSSTGVSQPELGIENPNQNWSRMRNRLNTGSNITMAFSVKKGQALPEFVHDVETGSKYRVVDGDTHDFRPFDAQPPGQPGVVVGLRNKAQTTKGPTAAVQSGGFFVHHDPALGNTVHIAPQPRSRIALNNDLKPEPGQ